MVPNICIIFHHNRMKHGHLLECCLCKPWFYNYFQIQNGKHLQYRPFIWHWNKRNSRLIVFTQLFIEFLYHWNNWSNVNWWMDKSTQLHLKLERKKIFFLEIQIKKKKKKKLSNEPSLYTHSKWCNLDLYGIPEINAYFFCADLVLSTTSNYFDRWTNTND